MADATLTRDNTGGADGTFGTLVVGSLGLVTAEEDRNANQRGISCIPPGVYVCLRTVYHKHGYETFEVTDVPGRSRILIHPGNTEEDTEGCILVGLRAHARFTVVDEDTGLRRDKRGIAESKPAFRRLMDDALQGVDRFTLEIRDPYWRTTP